MLEQATQFLMTQLQTNEFFSGAVLGGGILGMLAYLRGIPVVIYNFLVRRLTTEITITSFDPAYKYFQQVLAKTNFSKFSKRYGLVSDIDCENHTGDIKEEKKTLKFILTVYDGNYIFRYRNKFLLISCVRKEPSTTGGFSSMMMYETLTIRYLGIGKTPINQLIADAKYLFENKTDKGLRVFTPVNDWWQENSAMPFRKLDSIITDAGEAQQLHDDLTEFFSSEKWYVERNIPYHRGYLLYGPPGCGKTSSIYALASELRCGVYYFAPGDKMSNSDFIYLMNNVPPRSFIVFEDVDVLFEKRVKKTDDKVSFSTFINALDGFLSRHGSIVFMTTNHIDKLDPAMIRNSRIDQKVQFNHCTSKQIELLFDNFYKNKELAKQFAGIITNEQLSPADLQGYFMNYKHDASGAVYNAATLNGATK